MIDVEGKEEYEVLVHCAFPVLKDGFEYFLKTLPVKMNTSYQNLSRNLMNKLSPDVDMIILLEEEADADFGLCYKVKLFLADIPVLVIIPEAPVAYVKYLESMKDVHVLTSPFTMEEFSKAMNQMISLNK